MKKATKAALTKAKNKVEKWKKSYLEKTSPYITQQYIQATKKYKALMKKAAIQNKGEQLNLI